jgi:hypothetical protein
MPTGHTTPIPLSTWDRETLHAVCVAYRRVTSDFAVTIDGKPVYAEEAGKPVAAGSFRRRC